MSNINRIDGTEKATWDENEIWVHIYHRFKNQYDFGMDDEAVIIEYHSLIKDTPPFQIIMVPNFKEIVDATIELLCTKGSYEKDLLRCVDYKPKNCSICKMITGKKEPDVEDGFNLPLDEEDKPIYWHFPDEDNLESNYYSS